VKIANAGGAGGVKNSSGSFRAAPEGTILSDVKLTNENGRVAEQPVAVAPLVTILNAVPAVAKMSNADDEKNGSESVVGAVVAGSA
jgi:hypothetical protein